MLFFFKPKTITVDAFTAHVGAYSYAPLKKAAEVIPDWWKAIPKSATKPSLQSGIEVELPTMKSCAGFIDLYRHGLMIPLWSDLVIETDGSGNWKHQWADPPITAQKIMSHPKFQYGGFDGETHLKINSPWILNEKTGVNFVWVDPIWNRVAREANLKILPGVINYRDQHSTNINLLFWNRPSRIFLNHGDPIAHLIPMSDSPVKVVNHLVDQAEFDRLHQFSFYRGKFKGSHRMRKEINSAKSECPFSAIWKNK